MEQQRWMLVAGYGGRYRVSDCGRLQSRARGEWRDVCQERKDGYRRVDLFPRDERGTHRRVHQLVAEAFLGPAPEGHEINHIDGDKGNNAADNLEWVTRSQNQLHAERLGLINHARGERQGSAKLVAGDVRAIRRIRAETNKTLAEIGAMFGVTGSNIWAIVNRKSWRHI